VLYIPREPYELIHADGKRMMLHCSSLNMSPGTVTDDGEPQERWQNIPPFIPTLIHQAKYRIGPVDNVCIPTGHVAQALDHPEILQSVRQFCLNLMRSNQPDMFRRWHSRELSRRAYEEHIRATEPLP